MFKLKFSMANAAFDLPAVEVARILRDIARRIERGVVAGPVMDVNGNAVGKWNMEG